MMDNNFLISIITPFYNGNKYMNQLFNVVENNYKLLKKEFLNGNLELVIVNDSPSVVLDLQGITVDFAYKIINHQKNAGIHQARITGLNNCNGEYVLFLDQDDELLDNAILSQVKSILKDDADIAICNAYMEREDKSSYLLYNTKTDYRLLTDLNFYLKSHNVIKSPGQCLIKKSSIPSEWINYIVTRNGSDDLFLWILLLEKTKKFVVNKDALYIHKYTGENLSNSDEKMTDSSLEIVKIASGVKCIPNEHIMLLKRSREFSLELRKSSMIGKCCVVARNIDLFIYLAFNKIKRRII